MILDDLLIDATRKFLREMDIKEAFFADLLVSEQIRDIPDASRRIHFDEGSDVSALENNRKHLNRLLNGEERIPLRLLRPWMRVLDNDAPVNEICLACGGHFTPDPVCLDVDPEDGAIEHINRVLKEVAEALEAIRKDALDNGRIDDYESIRREISQAISALSGALEWCRVVAGEGAG